MGSGGSRSLWSPSKLVLAGSRLKAQGKDAITRFLLCPFYFALYPVFLCFSLSASASQLFPGKCRFRLFSFALGLLPAIRKSVISVLSLQSLSCQTKLLLQAIFSPWAFYLAPAAPTSLTRSNLDDLAPVRWIPWRVSIKLIGCYMVKPHGQLVHVSCTHYCASTSCLSTW